MAKPIQGQEIDIELFCGATPTGVYTNAHGKSIALEVKHYKTLEFFIEQYLKGAYWGVEMSFGIIYGRISSVAPTRGGLGVVLTDVQCLPHEAK